MLTARLEVNLGANFKARRQSRLPIRSARLWSARTWSNAFVSTGRWLRRLRDRHRLQLLCDPQGIIIRFGQKLNPVMSTESNLERQGLHKLYDFYQEELFIKLFNYHYIEKEH